MSPALQREVARRFPSKQTSGRVSLRSHFCAGVPTPLAPLEETPRPQWLTVVGESLPAG
ncbi:hypothetical protein [Dendronalium sp. ChiSLP03b]|uniref:hypothetical protein n=1 Tax=Dendronalium sp. ChiSLP03b TaxID=3075381 RepID=UPI00391AB661